MPDLYIIHTSDLHGRLTPLKAARLRALKTEHGALLVDTGDAIRAPNVALLPWRDRTIMLMNRAGYDLMGLGNREYFFRNRGMAWKTGHACFARVCTNLELPEKLASPKRWQILATSSGVRVGFLGLMPTMIAPGHWLEFFSDNRFLPWEQQAACAAQALRTHSDLVVALFHRPATEIEALCRAAPDIDLVLAGHAHLVREKLHRVGGVVVSFVGEGAAKARVIGLRLPGETVTMDRLEDLG